MVAVAPDVGVVPDEYPADKTMLTSGCTPTALAFATRASVVEPLFTLMFSIWAPLEVGWKVGEITQVTPGESDVEQVFVTLNAVLPAGLTAVMVVTGEVRGIAWLPMFVTVNTHGLLFPMLCPSLIVVPAQRGCAGDPRLWGTCPKLMIGLWRLSNRICLLPESATYRFPFASSARPAGEFKPGKLSAKGAAAAPLPAGNSTT